MKVFSNYYILFIFVIICISQSKGFRINEDRNISDILIDVTRFLTQKVNITILTNKAYGVERCYNYVSELLNNTLEPVQKAFDYSGKYLGDYGNEKECVFEEHFTYFLLTYQLDLESFNGTNQAHEMFFLDQDKYFTGICMFKECLPFVFNIFNRTIDKSFFKYLKEVAGITKTSIIYNNTLCYEKSNNKSDDNREVWSNSCGNTKPEEERMNIVFKSMGIGLTTIGILFILSSIGSIIFFFKFELEKEAKKIEEDDNSFEDNFISSSKQDSNSKEIIKNEDPIFKQDIKAVFDNKNNFKWKVRFYSIISIFDLFSNLSYLCSLSNYYYTDKGIEPIGFIRLIVMVTITYFINNTVLYISPPKDMFNHRFYDSSLIIFIKLANYCYVVWIILDGLVMSYKLMSYINQYKKNHNANYIPFSLFVKYLLFSIPKIVVYLLIFFFFYYYFREWSLIKVFDIGLLYKYFYRVFIEDFKYKCLTNPLQIFIPFLTFNDEGDLDFNYSTCFTFNYIMMNEFILSIVIILLIFFLSYKIKSKYFDYSIFIILIVNSIIIYSLTLAKKVNTMTIGIFRGETVTESIPWVMTNYYILGVLLGLCYFYFNETTSNDSIIEHNEFIPFNFCYFFIKTVHSLKYKKVFIYCIAFFILPFSMITIIIRIIKGLQIDYEIQKAYAVQFFFNYEKIIFAYIFFILSIFIIVYPKDSAFIQLMKTNIFIIIERISTPFLCISEWLVYFVFSTYHFQLNLSYQNLLFLAIGITMIIIVVSLIITISIEMPIRKLVKYLLREKNWENNNHERIEEDLRLTSQGT